MKTNNWLTALVMMIVGILLIIWHGRLDVLNWIVLAVGVLLIVPAVYSFFSALMRRRESRKESLEYSASASTMIAAVVCICIGVWMLINPGFFVGLLAYLLGAVLIFIGIFHIAFVGFWSRPFVMPGWLYIIPALMIIAGVVILCTSVRQMNSVVVLITGISLVCSAVSTILELVCTNPVRKDDSSK